MYRNQMKLTETLMFDYYLVSSSRENEIFSPFSHYINKELHQSMVESAETLDKLVRKIIKKHNNESRRYFEIGEFMYQHDILGLEIPLMPFFWTRYDAFCRAEGGIFFSEFNYDKPCAQREILLSGDFGPIDNPNKGFADQFRKGFQNIWKQYNKGQRKPRVAVLADPTHFEEVHLAYLYRDLLKDCCEEIFIAGSSNFCVKHGKAFAFDKQIDVILRQYPTEFLHEVNDFEELLKLYNMGELLLLNDPRAILGQAKSLFAYFWELVEKNDPFLTAKERETIKAVIPNTKVFHQCQVADLVNNKDKYVVKPIYGRYSIDVFIGNMHTDEEWDEVLQYVCESDSTFIVQEFCPIKKENTLKFENIGFEEKAAFGNYGIYLINGAYSGTCIRWSENYLSEDDMVWTCPVGISDKNLKLTSIPDNRSVLWERINEEAAFEWGYTNGYTGFQEAFALQALLLDQDLESELENATNKITQIFLKTIRYVQENAALLCPVLGISDLLCSLTAQNLTDCLTFIGRMDWILDNESKLKLLEFNAETPAGMMESIVLNELIRKNCNYMYSNPNEQMKVKLRGCMIKILEDYAKQKEIKTIGFIAANHYEDWYNTKLLFDCVKDLPYDFVLGEISALYAEQGRLWLEGKPLDAVYRYYPLDWFEDTEAFEGVLDTLQVGTLSINPPSTLICQSKAFFALIWELLAQGFYTDREADDIRRYIPKSSLTPKQLDHKDYVIKPYLGREGQDIVFNYSGKKVNPEENYVYQERVDIQDIDLEIYSTAGCDKVIAYPVIGTFVIGNNYGGVYVRAGSRITNNWAVYVPAFGMK